MKVAKEWGLATLSSQCMPDLHALFFEMLFSLDHVATTTSNNVLLFVNKTKQCMSNGDVWLGIVPSGAMRFCAQTVVHFLEPLVWPNLCPRDCPNPKKFPCNVCKACFTLRLGGAFSTN